MTTSQIIAAAKSLTLAENDAIYTDGQSVWLGKDGNQPSNTCCLAVGPDEDRDWNEIEASVEDYLA